jgi:hypothetical protein
MRRFLIVTSVAVSIVCSSVVAHADHRSATRPASRWWAKQWVTWAFGTDASPITTGICGEAIDGAFALTAAFNPGRAEIWCDVPAGTPVIATPGGTLLWSPTFGQTRDDLWAAVEADVATVSDVRMVLDGRRVALGDAFIDTHLFRMPLEPGNFVQQVDPSIGGDSVRAGLAGWFVKVRPLRPGEHRLVLADKLNGVLFKVVFHLAVG